MDRQAHKPRLSVVGDRYFILFLGYSALLCLYGPRHALASPPFCCPLCVLSCPPIRLGDTEARQATPDTAHKSGGG